MKYAPGDEVYCVGYTGRWRVDTVSAKGHPVLCTRLDADFEPAAVRNRDGLLLIDQQRMALNAITDFELCVVRDMERAQFESGLRRSWPEVMDTAVIWDQK